MSFLEHSHVLEKDQNLKKKEVLEKTLPLLALIQGIFEVEAKELDKHRLVLPLERPSVHP